MDSFEGVRLFENESKRLLFRPRGGGGGGFQTVGFEVAPHGRPFCISESPLVSIVIEHLNTTMFNQIQPEYGDEQADAGRDG